MPRLQDVIDRRASVWEKYQEILNRSKDADELSAEDRQALDRAETDIRQLTEDIERLQKAEGHRSTFEQVDRSGVPEDAREGDPTGRRGEQPPAEAGPTATREYQEAFDAYLRFGVQHMPGEARATLQDGFVQGEELRAQGVATDAAGGFLVPEGFRNKITETMKFFGGVRQVAGGLTTATGADLPWPSNDDTGNEGAYLAENTQATEQDVTFGQVKLGAHMITSKIVRVSFQLLQDSAFNLDLWLPKKLGERIGRRENRAFTVGTGTNEPEGVQTNATVGKTGATGQTTSVIYDDIIDLEHSVDPAYRNERSVYMWHDLTLASLRKIKDADNRPLWQPSVQAGAPDLFNGRRYVVNNDMPQMAASAKSILFGDFEAGYVIRDVRDIGLLRLTERYADFLQVGFLAFARHDGKPDDGAAIRAYQNSAT